MTNINLTDNRDFILDILEFNLYQTKNALVNGSIFNDSNEYNKLTRIQSLFDKVSSHLDVSLNHNELRELARCCFKFSDHFSHSSSSKIRINKLSIRVLMLFIKTCSRATMNRIAKIVFYHEPNEADIKTILAL